MDSTLCLESSKYAFRLEHLTAEERNLWMDNLKREGFPIKDPREIFRPFEGEVVTFFNKDVGTHDLRVRVWIWTDSKGQKHRLIDMLDWPGYHKAQNGIVAMDGKPIFATNESLVWLGEIDSEFEAALGPFFRNLSNLFEYRMKSEFKQFFKSKAGKEAARIENKAFDESNSLKNAIYSERRRLRSQYCQEFKVIAVLPKSTVIEWGSVKLVTTDHVYDHEKDLFNAGKTFILNEGGTIGRQIYEDGYLANSPTDAIMAALAIRVHSYMKVLRNCPSPRSHY